MTGTRKAAVSMGLLFGAAFSLLAGDGQWTNEGLPETPVLSLGIGQSPRALFAGTHLGVFRSTEAGVWSLIPGSPSNINVMACDPTDQWILYAGGANTGDGGFYKSTDEGGVLFQKPSNIGFEVRDIAMTTGEPDTVYIVGDSPNVFKTTDGGATWTESSDTAQLVGRIAALIIDPTRPGTLYAGADQGAEFNGDVYYPPYNPYPFAPVLRSVDSGAHWTPAMAAPVDAASQLYTTDLAVDAQTGILYAATSAYPVASVHRSRDGGFTWEQSRVDFASLVSALTVDPTTNPATLYAGTNIGIFRSLDEGSSWTPMNDGLYADGTFGGGGPWIHSLALDPSDGVLRAGTENGVFSIRPNAPSFPCTPAADHLCLLGGRYRVTVMAQHPTSLVVGRGVVIQQADRFGSFSLPVFTGDPAFPEVVVKMRDPGGDRGDWVFHAGLTNIPYILIVTDTTTGRVETYVNGGENRLCGGADTEAFYEQPPWDYAESPSPGHLLNAASPARSESESLLLLGGRFSVTLSATSARLGRTAPGLPVPQTDRYGYFSLPGFMGDPTFPEVFVKMVDFTSINGQFWFFHTGLTSLAYTLTVTDSETGTVKTYEGRGDYCAGADTRAFAD